MCDRTVGEDRAHTSAHGSGNRARVAVDREYESAGGGYSSSDSGPVGVSISWRTSAMNSSSLIAAQSTRSFMVARFPGFKINKPESVPRRANSW
ncbi:hypothetical protein GCM10023405_47970 [Streptomonospora salina]